MFEVDKKTGKLKLDDEGKFLPKTAHSLNPVPAIIYDPGNLSRARLADVEAPGIANLAATCMTLLGFRPPEDYTPSLVEVG
jgi:2,3-bisphosphoglycerate-independent phosphoglycerate mutase